VYNTSARKMKTNLSKKQQILFRVASYSVAKRLALIPEATNWFLTALARAKESVWFLVASPVLSV